MKKIEVLESTRAFENVFKIWKYFGIEFQETKSTSKRKIYLIFFRIVIIFYFPATMLLNLILEIHSMTRDTVDNAVFLMVMLIGTLKYIIISRNTSKINRILKICKVFDTSRSRMETKLKENFINKSKHLFCSFYFVLLSFATCSALYPTFLDARLILPEYFPFNWKKDKFRLVLVLIYQFFALNIYMTWTLTFDCFTALILSQLKTFTDILSLRLSEIINVNAKNAHESFLDIIENYKLLMEYFSIFKNLVSQILLWLFLQATAVIVIYIVGMQVSEVTFFEVIYIIVIILCFLFQITFQCFYGSQLSKSFEKFSEAIYSCPWYNQSKAFKNDLLIFLEFTMKDRELNGGGFFAVNLRTYSEMVYKMYSFYMVFRTVVINKSARLS